jgi:LacI family transcriptional regulator
MKSASQAKFRIAVALELTWELKHHLDVFAGAVRYANERPDWTCVIDDFAAESLRKGTKQRPAYDGIIARATPEIAEQAKRCRIPLVNVWFNSPVRGAPSVVPNFALIGKLVGQHLQSRGIRNLLCLIRRGSSAERVVAEHAMQVFHHRGGTCDVIRLPIRFAHSHHRLMQTRSRLLDWLENARFPVGILAGIDMLARHVAQICTETGIRIPEDVAIVGGDNEPTICLHPKPTLTSVECEYDNVGYQAAQMLHRLLRGDELKNQVVLIKPKELVVRQSSDFIYVDDEIVSDAMQFIARNSHRAIGVAKVAAAAGTARRTLELRFKNYVGRSVAAEIRRVRMDHARRLLANSDQSIAQIARLTGIGTAHHFARLFRREFGISPSEYRKQFLKSV